MFLSFGGLRTFRNWFKGNDTTSICRFIEWKFRRILAEYTGPHEDYLTGILTAATAGNEFLRTLYSSPLWMRACDAKHASHNGLEFMKAYKFIGAYALKKQWPRYNLTPKIHFLAHLVHGLRGEAARGHEVLNILSSSCQLDEDFVGRIASAVRVCSSRTVHMRTLEKYLINVAIRW